MKKLLILLLLPLLLWGCSEREEGPYLEVRTTAWSGWNPDDEPTEEVAVYKAVPNLILPSQTYVQPTFTVLSVSDTEIRIQSNIALSKVSSAGGIDLHSEERDFVIPYGETIKLATLTMDAGWIYELTYVPEEEG